MRRNSRPHPVTHFVGWHRAEGGAWTAAVEAEERQACMRQLLRLAGAADFVVLPEGQEPGERPPGMLSRGTLTREGGERASEGR